MTTYFNGLGKRNEIYNQGAHIIMNNILNSIAYKLNILADSLSYEPSMDWSKHWLNPLLPKCRKRLCPL
ncbi:hypothetical protein [Pseudobacteroides cellulosolvens]|uniref:Uncharacterized protein n=1 Tax=Pseudobacteroides cellulosolvens ATCC 35603 = DSM 2933 TaxID=398512 RepID=A0A0L6JWX1_9FIRM|nr:hypothetical protein [Pseudobacteroides cellulosolvens]KNY30105.1 hypothetical protein Bccel_5382 [Pseudobacteroides cellulosolvens ATCC 35603 = DSM 2933]